jgi:hypothetical protein
MVTLEQIRLLESKIARAIDFVSQVTEENARLKKRNDELGEAITRLREEKTKVEEGIVSALSKLNQFEDAIERSLSATKSATRTAANPAPGPAAVSPSNPPSPPRPEPAPRPPVQEAAPAHPAVPSAYMVDEAEEPAEAETEAEEDEDSGEAELDIF